MDICGQGLLFVSVPGSIPQRDGAVGVLGEVDAVRSPVIYVEVALGLDRGLGRSVRHDMHGRDGHAIEGEPRHRVVDRGVGTMGDDDDVAKLIKLTKSLERALVDVAVTEQPASDATVLIRAPEPLPLRRADMIEEVVPVCRLPEIKPESPVQQPRGSLGPLVRDAVEIDAQTQTLSR